MTIKIVDFPIKNGDFPVRYVKLPEGNIRDGLWLGLPHCESAMSEFDVASSGIHSKLWTILFVKSYGRGCQVVRGIPGPFNI